MAKKSPHSYQGKGFALVPKMKTYFELDQPVEGHNNISATYLDNSRGRLKFVGNVPRWVAGNGELVFQAYIAAELVRPGKQGGLVANLNGDSEIIVAGPSKGQNPEVYNYARRHLN